MVQSYTRRIGVRTSVNEADRGQLLIGCKDDSCFSPSQIGLRFATGVELEQVSANQSISNLMQTSVPLGRVQNKKTLPATTTTLRLARNEREPYKLLGPSQQNDSLPDGDVTDDIFVIQIALRDDSLWSRSMVAVRWA